MVDEKIKVGVELDTEKVQQQLKSLFEEFNQYGRLTRIQSQSVSDISGLLSAQRGILDIKRKISNENDKAIRDARELNRLSSRVLESAAGALGGYQARHGIRAITSFQELQSSMSQVAGEEVGVGSVLMEIGASAATMLPAIAIFAAGAFAAGKAFELVEMAARQVASGIMKIGGIRSLDQIMVETAGAQRQAAMLARLSSTPMSRGQAFDLIENNSANSRFSSAEVSKMFIDFAKGSPGGAGMLGQTVSGGAGTFGQGLLEIGNVYDPNNPEAAIKGLAKYQTMTGADANQTLDFGMRALFAQQQGGLDFFANPNAFSRLINEGKGTLPQEMTAATLFARGLGGTDRSDVSKLLKFEKQGGRTDSTSLAQNIVGGQGDFGAIRNYVQGQGVNTNSQSDVKAFIDKMNDGSQAAQAFTQALVDAKDTVEDKWKTAVNAMTSSLERALLPVLIELTPAIQELTTYITDHKEEVGEAVRQLGNGLINVAEGLVAFSHVVFSVMDSILATVFPGAVAQGKAAQHTLDTEGDVTLDPSGGAPAVNTLSPEDKEKLNRQVVQGKLMETVHQRALEEAAGSSSPSAMQQARDKDQRRLSGEKDVTADHAKKSVEHLQDISDVIKRTAILTQQMNDQNIKNNDKLITAINASKNATGTPAHPDKK